MRAATRTVLCLMIVIAPVIAASQGGAGGSLQGRTQEIGSTDIATWQHGRAGAVSVTYDDASVNQFRVAAPLMTARKLAGTFFVLTGAVTGSDYPARFVGRPTADILRESADIPTNAANFRERISAAPFLGFAGLIGLRTSAAPAGPQTFARIDEAYRRARVGELPPLAPNACIYMDNGGIVIQEPPRADVHHATWDDVRRIAGEGHEVGSHTIMHARLDALDEPNIRYELAQSRQELREQVGERHTFSAEAPFGIEDERVMSLAYGIYPALRNRMPHPWLDELNRSSQRDPSSSDRPYVQWQRGILTRTTTDTMRSWLDRTAADGRIWLVLTIHGVDGVGWEPVAGDTLATFFDDLTASQDRLWIATFQDVTKYLRERMSASADGSLEGASIRVTVRHSLDPALYDLPLTLRTRVPEDWNRVRVVQGATGQVLPAVRGTAGSHVRYLARPNAEPVFLSAE